MRASRGSLVQVWLAATAAPMAGATAGATATIATGGAWRAGTERLTRAGMETALAACVSVASRSSSRTIGHALRRRADDFLLDVCGVGRRPCRPTCDRAETELSDARSCHVFFTQNSVLLLKRLTRGRPVARESTTADRDSTLHSLRQQRRALRALSPPRMSISPTRTRLATPPTRRLASASRALAPDTPHANRPGRIGLPSDITSTRASAPLVAFCADCAAAHPPTDTTPTRHRHGARRRGAHTSRISHARHVPAHARHTASRCRPQTRP